MNSQKSILVFISFFFIFYFLFYHQQIQDLEYLEFGDGATIGIKIENAKMFKEYLGAYSRMNFAHPGPVVFYIYAFFEKFCNFFSLKLKFSAFTYYLVAQFFLNFFFLGFLQYLLFTIFNDLKKIILFDFLFFIFLENINHNANYSFLFEIWLPVVTIIPYAYIIFYLVYLLNYKKMDPYLIIAFFGLGIMISNHISSISFAAFPLFIILVFIIYKRKFKIEKKEIYWFLNSLILIFLIFLPPLIEQIQYGKEGNIYKILKITAQTNALRRAKDVFIYFFELWSLFFTSRVHYKIGIIIFLILNFFILYLRKKESLLYDIYKLLNFLTFITLIYIFKIPFDLLHYLSWFYISIFTVYVFIFLLFLMKIQVSKKLYYIIISLLFIIFVLQNLKVQQREVDKNPIELQIEKELLSFYKFENTIQYKILWGFNNEDHDLWPLSMGLVYELHKKKINVCVDENWIFMAGKEFKCNQNQIKEILITKKEKENYKKILSKKGIYIYIN